MRFLWNDGDRAREVELSAEGEGRFRASVDGAEIEIEARRLDGDRFRILTSTGAKLAEVTAAGDRRFVRLGTLDFVIERERADRRRGGSAHGGGLEVPMPGVVTRVMVAAGDRVVKGQPLVALEAMKMEHVIRAPRDGRVRSVAVTAGQMVDGGVPVAELAENEDSPE